MIRPTSATNRLRRHFSAIIPGADLGIRPGQARSTALFQLATETPAAILARSLGIHTDVAATWQRLSAGDWTTYAAGAARRTPHPARHSDGANT